MFVINSQSIGQQDCGSVYHDSINEYGCWWIEHKVRKFRRREVFDGWWFVELTEMMRGLCLSDQSSYLSTYWIGQLTFRNLEHSDKSLMMQSSPLLECEGEYWTMMRQHGTCTRKHIASVKPFRSLLHLYRWAVALLQIFTDDKEPSVKSLGSEAVFVENILWSHRGNTPLSGEYVNVGNVRSILIMVAAGENIISFPEDWSLRCLGIAPS